MVMTPPSRGRLVSQRVETLTHVVELLSFAQVALPDISTTTRHSYGVLGSKMAPTVWLLSIVIVQEVGMPGTGVQFADQPSNTEPWSATATNVTAVPCVKLPIQPGSGPQLMTPLPVTFPFRCPP
jgi:hypothetical protein